MTKCEMYIAQSRLLPPESGNVAQGTERSLETIPIANTVVVVAYSWLHNLIGSHSLDRMLCLESIFVHQHRLWL